MELVFVADDGHTSTIEVDMDCTVAGLQRLVDPRGSTTLSFEGNTLRGGDVMLADLGLCQGSVLTAAVMDNEAALSALRTEFGITDATSAITVLSQIDSSDLPRAALLIAQSGIHKEEGFLAKAVSLFESPESISCLLSGMSPEEVRGGGLTELARQAVLRGNARVLRVLLQAGVEVGDQEERVLPFMTCAALSGSLTVVKLLAEVQCPFQVTKGSGDNIFHTLAKAPTYAIPNAVRIVKHLRMAYPEEVVYAAITTSNAAGKHPKELVAESEKELYAAVGHIMYP